MKKIYVIILITFLTLCSCAKEITPVQNTLEILKNAEIIDFVSDSSSIKKRIDISADKQALGVKTDSFNREFRQNEYTVSAGGYELFSVRAVNPEGISDRSFDMYAVYESNDGKSEKTLSGYIQSDVFRGNESYIIYDEKGEKYAFCDIEKNKNELKPEYKIISFEDELLYILNVSNPYENKFDMSLKPMRPDAENDISALALAFIINTDYHNEYFKAEEEKNKREKGHL